MSVEIEGGCYQSSQYLQVTVLTLRMTSNSSSFFALCELGSSNFWIPSVCPPPELCRVLPLRAVGNVSDPRQSKYTRAIKRTPMRHILFNAQHIKQNALVYSISWGKTRLLHENTVNIHAYGKDGLRF